jgi:hypothetical protein
MEKNKEVGLGVQKIEGFIIRKGSRVFDGFRFLAGAASKDVTRTYMGGIHLEREENHITAVTTDGHRLHIVEFDDIDLEPGNYQFGEIAREYMILYPMDGEVNYPNWKRVVPKNYKHFPQTFSEKKKDTMAKFSQEISTLFSTTGLCFNMEYIEALRGNEWEINFKSHGDNNVAVLFKSGNKTAVIMPMQKDEAPQVIDDTPVVKPLLLPAPCKIKHTKKQRKAA